MNARRLAAHAAPPFLPEHCPEDARIATLPIPGYLQTRNYTCGFASALMILRYFGCNVSARDLFDQLGTTRSGTRQTAIVQVLRRLGVSANIRYDVSFDRLRTAIDRGKPIIGYLSDHEHWLVIYGYGRTPDRVFVADPRPDQGCELDWELDGARLGNFGIVCSSDRRSISSPRHRAQPLPAGPLFPHESPAGQMSFDFSDS